MTEPKTILHFVTPLKNVSPFDVNMATDAGFDVVVPYTDVDLKEVAGLVQDAIFSRAPENGSRTVFGGTGPVGRIAALIAAQAGSKVSLVGYDGLQRVTATCDQFGERFGVAMAPADGSEEAGKLGVIADAEVILAAGRAGTQILSTSQLATARQLKVALDVNAVPPAGLEGVDAFADGTQPDAYVMGPERLIDGEFPQRQFMFFFEDKSFHGKC